MRKPQVRRIVPHFVHDPNPVPLSDRLAELHIQVIENRLNRLKLTAEQKIEVVDRMIANLGPDELHKLRQQFHPPE